LVDEKFIVGRFLTFSKAIMMTKMAVQDGTMVDQPPKFCSIEQSVSSGMFSNKTKTSGIAAGLNQKVRRNFNFLTFYPGVVTQTTLDQADVLTGPMSGCWIMLYKDNGVVKVGHVGTFMTPDNPKSVAAKAAWTQFAAAHPDDLVGGFNPFTYWKESGFPPKEQHDGGSDVYALVTSARRFFSIYLYKQHGGTPNRYRIAGVQPIFSAPRSALQAIPRVG
jgi:hypothetical protein